MPVTAPTAEDFERLARAALARIPEPFAEHLRGVVLRIEDWPDDETLDAMGIDNAFELTGLYEGLPVGDKTASLGGEMPDRITLYRRPLLDEWAETGVDLGQLITHVVVHEVGHHFGLSDEQMHAIEDSI